MEKNEKYELLIDGMTSEGQGVGRVDGLVVFVDGALPGERVLVHIVKTTSSYAIGKLLNLIEKSPSRNEAFCPVFDSCGGCTLQHMTYEATLSYKTGVVRDALQRIAGIDATVIESLVNPAIGMEKPLNYRNKAQYPVGSKDGKAICGFFAKRTHDIVAHEYCFIQDEISGQVRSIFLDFMLRHPNELTIYNEKTGRGLVRHLMTRVGFRTGEVMVVLVLTAKHLPFQQELIDALTHEISGLKSVFINLNTARSNIILGSRCIKIFGADLIFDMIGNLTFRISPLSFFQVNPLQTEALLILAYEFAGLKGGETIFDLYCGTGTIGLFAVSKFMEQESRDAVVRKPIRLVGVEAVPVAIEDACANASANGIANCEFHVGEVEVLLHHWADKASVVFLDPPRKGCEQGLLDALIKMSPERIVYVSCNPATLARDVKFLIANSYVVEKVQPVDMFPWTNHVESVVLLTRVEG